MPIPNPLFIEHDAAAVAAIAGVERPLCRSLMMRLGSPGEVFAAAVDGNPLGEDWLLDVELPARRIISWSGTLAGGDEPFAADPRNWLLPGRTALNDFCDQIALQLQAHDRLLCLRPHARHVLSDAVSAAAFFRDRSGPFELAFEPTALLEASMLRDLEDHLTRMFELLAPRCSILMLRDIRPGAGSGLPEPVSLGEGMLPRDAVLKLIEQWLPPETPMAITSRSIEAQRQWIGF